MGQQYTLTFYAESDSDPNILSASFGGQTVLTLNPVPTDSTYRQYSALVTATSSMTDISFTGGDDSNRIWIDDVSLVAVASAPEPSQYAAFGIGLFGLGVMALRARRRQAA